MKARHKEDLLVLMTLPIWLPIFIIWLVKMSLRRQPMPVDSQGNFGSYPDAPPYWARGRKGYRKWLKQKYGSLNPKKWS